MFLEHRERVFTANWKEAPACPRKLAVEVTFSDQINFQIIGFVFARVREYSTAWNRYYSIGFVFVFPLWASLLMSSWLRYTHFFILGKFDSMLFLNM